MVLFDLLWLKKIQAGFDKNSDYRDRTLEPEINDSEKIISNDTEKVPDVNATFLSEDGLKVDLRSMLAPVQLEWPAEIKKAANMAAFFITRLDIISWRFFSSPPFSS